MKRTLIGLTIGLVLSLGLFSLLYKREIKNFDGYCGPKVMGLEKPCSRIQFLKEYTAFLLPNVPKKLWVEFAVIIILPTAFGILIDTRLRKMALEEHKSINENGI